MADAKEMNRIITLSDNHNETKGFYQVALKMTDGFLEMQPEGCGEFDASPGCGHPVILEFYEGVPRLIVFGDINSSEPTHIIPLDGALETARKPYLYHEVGGEA